LKNRYCDASINYFIEEMAAIGDYWTVEEVKDVYGRKSLEDALNERKSVVDSFLQNFALLMSEVQEA
jgi:hypothetical protein